MARPRRRAREIALTQSHILDAAARLFAEKGFASTSIQEIAEAAGYSAPSLYSYFPSKQSILDGLVATIIAEASTLFDVEFPHGLTLRQRLELLLRHHDDWAEKHRDAFVFFLQRGGANEAAKGPNPPPDLRDSHIDSFAKWFKRNAEPGELGDVSPQVAAMLLDGINHAFFLDWMRKGARGALSRTIPTVLDFFFNGVRGGATAEEEAKSSKTQSTSKARRGSHVA